MGSRFFFLKWPPTSSPLTWCSNLPGNSSLSGDGVVLIFTRFFLPLQQANFTPLYLSHNSQLFRCPLFTSNPDPVSGQDLLTFPCLPASPNTHWIHTGMKSDDSFHPAFHRKWPIRLNQAARHQFRGANSAKIRGTVFKFEATFFLYCSNDTDGVKIFLSADDDHDPDDCAGVKKLTDLRASFGQQKKNYKHQHEYPTELRKKVGGWTCDERAVKKLFLFTFAFSTRSPLIVWVWGMFCD